MTFSNKSFTVSYNKAIRTISLYRTKYNYEYIINQIKKEICVNCTSNINKKNVFLLPCNCILCSEKCIKEFYYTLISAAYFKQEFICFCNTKYNNEYCLTLIEKLNEKKYDCKEMIELLFNKFNKNKCFLCSNKIKNKYKECLFIEPNFVLNRIIKHIICSVCTNKNEFYVGQNIYCQLCKRNHLIEKIEEKINENKTKEYNFSTNDDNIDIKIYKKYNEDISVKYKNNNKNKNTEIKYDENNDEKEKVTIIKIYKKKKNNK